MVEADPHGQSAEQVDSAVCPERSRTRLPSALQQTAAPRLAMGPDSLLLHR